MTTYVDFAKQVPEWMQKAVGQKYLAAHAKELDELVRQMMGAVESPWPLNCPNDALGFIGAERQLEQYPNESIESYRIRLWDAWEAWYWAGTDKGILDQFRLATGLTEVSIRNNRDWVPAPPDGNTSWWSRFWVVVGEPHPYSMYKWGEGKWGDGRRWGGTIHQDVLSLMSRVIRKWKPSHAYCEGILIQYGNVEILYPVRA